MTLKALAMKARSASKGQSRYRHLRELLRHETLEANQIRDYQAKKVRTLVRHAYQTVPYYGQLLRSLGMTPDDFQTPEDLAKIPPLTKELVRANLEDLVSTAIPRSELFPHSTGGSTGSPLQFYRWREYDERCNVAGNYRSFMRVGFQLGEPMVSVWAPTTEPPATSWVRRLRRAVRALGEENVTILDSFDMGPAAFERWIDIMRRTRARFLYAFTTSVALFARFCRDRGVTFPRFRAVICTAESMLPAYRTVLHEVFPAAIIQDIYGAREVLSIGAECARGKMHIHTDLVVVEFGPPTADGTARRLYVTALDNLAVPFIRYDIGDCGVPGEETCDCGLPFPTMRMGVGRVFDNFISPEGRIVSGVFFKNIMDSAPGIHAYQFRQVATDKLILSVVPSPSYGPSFARYFEGLRAQVRETFSPRAALELRIVDHIPTTAAGKYRFIVSDIVSQSDAVHRNSRPTGEAEVHAD